ncbi:motility associated factor glycosyltransferase family protein [Effusibacillus consociatus]|uniref:Motility associated factor glycosyltransferase family protein n=1 Tax=Effusibacillus consociatus TaxID=1117041 RepID=A0ABV9Q220_9BACL
MNRTLARNEDALREHRYKLYMSYLKWGDESEEGVVVQTEPSKSGIPTLHLQTFEGEGVVYSKYQPMIEVERWADEQRLEEAVILVGFGLGYPAIVLRRNNGKKVPMLILEPSRRVFVEAMKTVDLTDLIGDENCEFVIGEKVSVMAFWVGELLRKHLFKVTWLEWPAYRRLFKTTIEEIRNQVKKISKGIRLDQNTILLFQRDWCRNNLFNLNSILRNPGVNKLFGKFKGRPAIVVSAGPSLSKNVSLLHEIKGKAVIVCVDTAYRVLQNQGILPDLLVALDGSEKNYQHFIGVTPTDVPLVFLPTAHYKILEEHGKRCFSSNASHEFLISDVIQYVEEKGELMYGGSVATLAFDLAYRMGADPIILIGQDLAYPGGKAYADGTIYEDMKKSIHDGTRMLYVEGIDGEPVLTDHTLDHYRRWFEERIESLGSGIKVIDATEGGAKIAGTDVMTLNEVSKRFCIEKFDITGIINEAVVPPKEDLTKVIEELRRMSRVLHQLKRLAKLALKKNTELRDLYKVPRFRVKKVIECSDMLEQIELKINLLNQKKWLDLLIQHRLLTIIQGQYTKESPNENEYQKAMRITQNAELLYSGILEASIEIKGYVEEAINRIIRETNPGSEE